MADRVWKISQTELLHFFLRAGVQLGSAKNMGCQQKFPFFGVFLLQLCEYILLYLRLDNHEIEIVNLDTINSMNSKYGSQLFWNFNFRS